MQIKKRKKQVHSRTCYPRSFEENAIISKLIWQTFQLDIYFISVFIKQYLWNPDSNLFDLKFPHKQNFHFVKEKHWIVEYEA